MKKVLITGASGFLGHLLVKSFVERGDTQIIAILGRPEDKVNSLPQNDKLKVYPSSVLFSTDFGHVDTLIHTAFSRGDNLPGLTRSIELSKQIIELVNRHNIDSIINISSQGIYKGLKPGEKVDENGFVEPNTAYGLAKWAVENLLSIGCQKRYTNIRMASLSTNARFLDFFVDCVVAGKDITVTAPYQFASIMDVTDAVAGIVAIESLDTDKRETTYNLGPGTQHSILDLAETANEFGRRYGYTPVSIKVDDKGNNFAICMDCRKIIEQTGWKPIVTKADMLLNMFNQKR